MSDAHTWRPVDVVAFGKKLRGSYVLDGDRVRVRTSQGEDSALALGRNPQSVAAWLLIGMADEGKV